MLNAEVRTGTTVYVPFYDHQYLEGKTSFSITILKDNELYLGMQTPPTLTEFGDGLYSLAFVLAEAGYYAVCVEGIVYAYLIAVTKSSNDILQDLNDVTLGSYRYDKETGLLTLYRQTGGVLTTYTVVDNNQQTSRELIS